MGMGGVVGFVPIQGTADLSRIEAPVTFKAYLLCAFAAFGGVCKLASLPPPPTQSPTDHTTPPPVFGYDTGWMSGVLGMPYFISMYTGFPYDYEAGKPIGMDVRDFALPASKQSLMTSILSCGTFFGALIGGDLADFVGRRPTIIYGCLIFCVGCVLQISSTNQEALFVMGRLVAGLGVGFISAVIILYMSEIAPRKVRGALVSAYQFCITLGILLANCVVFSTQKRNDTGSYRIPIAVQFLWAIILGVGLYLLREYPTPSPFPAGSDPPQPNPPDTTSKKASSISRPRPSPSSAASPSTPSTSRTSSPRSSPTTSTRCK